MLFGIKLEGWLTIAAIILGPLLAFVVQHWRDNRRERRNRKLFIFSKLMMTLRANLSPNHVDAINSIHVEFHDEENVLRAWRLYVSHLNIRRAPGSDGTHWNERRYDLLVDLVYAMAQSLGYTRIDKASIRDSAYIPQGYADVEAEQEAVRKRLLEVLTGQRPIPMTMVGPVQVEEPISPVPIINQPAPATLPSAPVPKNNDPQHDN
jgi:hypothetical protein